MTRKARLPMWLLGMAFVLPGCGWDGHVNVLGYTTRPNYDTNIRTVYVPIFQNRTFRKGMEFDLTRAVVREIEAKTPYKVVSDCESADTELTGTIIRVNKRLLNVNQLNEIREGEVTLAVEVLWKDRRTGEYLSQPKPPQEEFPLDRPPDDKPIEPKPALVQSIGNYIPELGESNATAYQKNVNRLAVQIVSLMEKPW